jgi:uncharacterized protein YcfL
MRHTIFGLIALVLLAGCTTPPPPAPGSSASKVLVMGNLKNIDIGPMRVARENGFMTVNVSLHNTSSYNKTMYYRFAWLDSDGFPVAEPETWKSLTLYGTQSSFLPAIAPVPKASDLRLEVKTP